MQVQLAEKAAEEGWMAIQEAQLVVRWLIRDARRRRWTIRECGVRKRSWNKCEGKVGILEDLDTLLLGHEQSVEP